MEEKIKDLEYKIRDLEGQMAFKDELLSIYYNMFVEIYKSAVKTKNLIEEEFVGIESEL